MTDITFVGHATILIRTDGLNIITDPMFSAGPPFHVFKRANDAGMCVDELPKIDVILISHSHLDHFDKRSLRKMSKQSMVIVPPGYRKKLERMGFTDVRELDGKSWESARIGKVGITAVKSYHARNCNGYVIKGKHTLYFPGDTGYFDGIKKIAERFKVDVVFLPLMRWIPLLRLFNHHIDAEQAVEMVKVLKPAKYAIPIHWGFYPRSETEMKIFVSMMKKEGFGNKLLVLRNGEKKTLA